jgi:hypothetical protein
VHHLRGRLNYILNKFAILSDLITVEANPYITVIALISMIPMIIRIMIFTIVFQNNDSYRIIWTISLYYQAKNENLLRNYSSEGCFSDIVNIAIMIYLYM